MPLTIKAALADNWLTGKEARELITNAVKGNVSTSELAAFAKLLKSTAKIAPSTKVMLEQFQARHARMDLEIAPLADLRKLFDDMDFWHQAKLLGWQSATLPAAVKKGYEAELALDGLTLEDVEEGEHFRIPVGGSYVYGVHQDNGSGFAINLYSPKGRPLWSVSGQND